MAEPPITATSVATASSLVSGRVQERPAPRRGLHSPPRSNSPGYRA